MGNSDNSARFEAVLKAGSRVSLSNIDINSADFKQPSSYFGENVFSYKSMSKFLNDNDINLLKELTIKNAKISNDLAKKIAIEVKEWALEKGATHYCHWFHPQTGNTAEKHDAFLSFDNDNEAIDKFTQKQLIQGEPDASSFPSGGQRSTFEARGYTAWDPSSPMFIFEGINSKTLCIPSIFISYNGEALGQKTPLLRSVNKINEYACEALALLGRKSKWVIPTAGVEQEYFLVDESLYTLRQDLIQTGRTLLGCVTNKNQQLSDHYFGSIKPRVLSFMVDFDKELYKLGIPSKTRHNEVASSQYETAPIYEQINVATDHNQLVMEIIKNVAKKHKLHALFHEKPFAGINGSGKHLNWSLSDCKANNLLNPGKKPEDNLVFQYFLAACIKAVDSHSELLRVSTASAGNDFRLGANEAPPSIISVFLGEHLSSIMGIQSSKESDDKIDFGVETTPEIEKDKSDRNRTSPFAFTGDKFEFRAVGSSASVSTPATMINSAVALALKEMNTNLKSLNTEPTDDDIKQVIKETLANHKRVCFEGNNYSQEWQKEAEKRGLANLRNTPTTIARASELVACLEEIGVLSQVEFKSRLTVSLENYNMKRMVEAKTLLDMINSQIIPATTKYLTVVGESFSHTDKLNIDTTHIKDRLTTLASLNNRLIDENDKMTQMIKEVEEINNDSKASLYIADKLLHKMNEVAEISNSLEMLVDDTYWPIPKNRELLFLV